MKWFSTLCDSLLNMLTRDANGKEKAFIVSTVKEVVCIYCTCVTYCIFIMPGVWGGCSAMFTGGVGCMSVVWSCGVGSYWLAVIYYKYWLKNEKIFYLFGFKLVSQRISLNLNWKWKGWKWRIIERNDLLECCFWQKLSDFFFFLE